MKIKMIREIGNSRRGGLLASYSEIVSVLGEPNVTDMNDPRKVKASWGFQDEKGRKGFVWCYREETAEGCNHWSVDGDFNLLRDLFGGKVG